MFWKNFFKNSIIFLFTIKTFKKVSAFENHSLEDINNTFNQQTSSVFQNLQITTYFLIWLIGSIGGLLVIYVILFNSKLKTITNIILLNLAIADFIYLQGIPFYLTSLINQEWIFSLFTCKLYWTFTGVNQFTAIFILTLLAYDRYLAVCRPDLSNLRKITCSKKTLLSLWTVSIIFMLPIILYSNIDTISIETADDGHIMNSSLILFSNYSIKYFKSCTILWPENNLIQLELAFIFYGWLFSFFIPIVMISVFYVRIVIRLRKNRKKLNLRPVWQRKDRRKATFLVLLVIAIYAITYTPFWIYQIVLLTTYIINNNNNNNTINQNSHQISAMLSSLFQLLVYLNSMLNPFLYAFISEIFRTSFKEAIKCSKSSNIFSNCMYRMCKISKKNSINTKNNHNLARKTTTIYSDREPSNTDDFLNKEDTL